MWRAGFLPQDSTCKLGRNLYDKGLDYDSKQEFVTENLQSLPVCSRVLISARVLSGVSFLTIFLCCLGGNTPFFPRANVLFESLVNGANYVISDEL